MNAMRDAIDDARADYQSVRYAGDLGELAKTASPQRGGRRPARWLPGFAAIAAGLLFVVNAGPTPEVANNETAPLSTHRPEPTSVITADASPGQPAAKPRPTAGWPSVLDQLARLRKQSRARPRVEPASRRTLSLAQVRTGSARRAKLLLAAKSGPPPGLRQANPESTASPNSAAAVRRPAGGAPSRAIESPTLALRRMSDGISLGS